MTALGLVVLLVAVWLICKRTKLAPVPLRLPGLAILLWIVHASLPASIAASENKLWLDLTLQLGKSYAALQLVLWLTLELPAPISWWPHPPKILRDLGVKKMRVMAQPLRMPSMAGFDLEVTGYLQPPGKA